MAGSFGYSRDHYAVSRSVGERKLFPAIRSKGADAIVVAAGTSCRHQIADFTGESALHPAVLLDSLMLEPSEQAQQVHRSRE
jgi:Fe-S oxidoreductase